MGFEKDKVKCRCEEIDKIGAKIADRILCPFAHTNKLISHTDFEYLNEAQRMLFVFSRFQAYGLTRKLISYRRDTKGFVIADGETEVWYAYLEKIIAVYRVIFARLQNKPRGEKYFTVKDALYYESELLKLEPDYVLKTDVAHILNVVEGNVHKRRERDRILRVFLNSLD